MVQGLTIIKRLKAQNPVLWQLFYLMMRNYIIYVLLLAVLFAGTAKSKKTAKSKAPAVSGKNHFPNVIKVEQFGDSVRLEVEKQGNTLIKHYIDLKGLADDNFDDSYNVVCNYETIKNDTNIHSNFSFVEGDFKLYFNRGEVISYCDSVIRHLKS